MTDVGAGLVYGLFLLGGFLLLAWPVAVVATVGSRIFGGFARGLLAALAVVTAGGLAVGVGTGFSFAAARVVVLLGAGYVVVPLAVGVAVLVLAGVNADEAARLATYGWLAALVALGGVQLATGGGVLGALSLTPSLFGLAWFSGYLALMAVVGLLAGGVGVGWRRHGHRLVARTLHPR